MAGSLVAGRGLGTEAGSTEYREQRGSDTAQLVSKSADIPPPPSLHLLSFPKSGTNWIPGATVDISHHCYY